MHKRSQCNRDCLSEINLTIGCNLSLVFIKNLWGWFCKAPVINPAYAANEYLVMCFFMLSFTTNNVTWISESYYTVLFIIINISNTWPLCVVTYIRNEKKRRMENLYILILPGKYLRCKSSWGLCYIPKSSVQRVEQGSEVGFVYKWNGAL